MYKMDRQGARAPAQLEQKYRFGQAFQETEKKQTEQERQLAALSQTLALFMASNTLAGKVTGDKVILKDVSPVEHTLTVRLLSNTVTDFTTVTVSRYGETEDDKPETYTPNQNGIVGGVRSIYPITTLTTDTDGVVIEVIYSKDLNKAI